MAIGLNSYKETNITILNADTAAINTKYILNTPLSGNFISDNICGEKISNLSISINNENIKTSYRIDEYNIKSNYSCYLVQLPNLSKENSILETIDIKFVTKINTRNLEIIEARDILGNVSTDANDVLIGKVSNINRISKDHLLLLNSIPYLDQPYFLNYSLHITSIKDFFVVPSQIIELNIPGESEPMDILTNPTVFNKFLFIEKPVDKTIRYDYYPLIFASNPKLNAGVFGSNTSESFRIGMNMEYLGNDTNADKAGIVNFGYLSTFGPACIKDVYYKDLKKSDYDISSFEFIPDRSNLILTVDSIKLKYLSSDEIEVSSVFHISPNPLKTSNISIIDSCGDELKDSLAFILFLDNDSQRVIDTPLLNDGTAGLSYDRRQWMLYLPGSETVGTSPSGRVHYFGGRADIFYFDPNISSYKFDFKIYNTNRGVIENRHRINILFPYEHVIINPNIQIEILKGYVSNISTLNLVKYSSMDGSKEVVEIPYYINISNPYESFDLVGNDKLVLSNSKDILELGSYGTNEPGFSVLSFDLKLVNEGALLINSINLYNLSYEKDIYRGDQSYISFNLEFDDRYSDLIKNAKICSYEYPTFCSSILKQKMAVPINFDTEGYKELHFFIYYNDQPIEEINKHINDSSRFKYPIIINVNKPFTETWWFQGLIVAIIVGVLLMTINKKWFDKK